MMTEPTQMDTTCHLRDDHDIGPAHAGHLMMATVVCGFGAALAVFWSEGSALETVFAYLLGGWCGVAFAALVILWYDRTT
jgi:hypothetical protein